MTDTKDPISWIKSLLTFKKDDSDNSLREALQDFIEELSDETPDVAPSAHERLIMSNLLKLRDMVASDVMIPRADIIAADVSMAPDEFLNLLSEKQYSRVPIYRESLDDVLGTIHIKDVLAAITKNQPFTLKNLIREALIVSPSLPVSDLLLLMKQSKKHLAFVVDEYGGTSGLVSLEDVIEEIVGDISDEFDDEHLNFSQIDEKNFLFEGKINLKDFYRIIDVDEAIFESHKGEAETLAGLILEILGNFPKKDQKVTFENCVFEIEAVDKKRIKQIKVTIE